MKLKASLHLHTKEDLSDGRVIDYDIFRLIDEAKNFKFQVLALTCHKTLANRPEFVAYAKQQGILLIGGIELELSEGKRRPHVVVLNPDVRITKVTNLKELKKYKQDHPEIFVLAAHPNAGGPWSLGLKLLSDNWDVFDAVEHTWFYSFLLNSNRQVVRLALARKKPVIATSDLHVLKYLDTDYTIIDSPDLELSSILKSLKNGRVKNITTPKNLVKMFLFIARFWLWSNLLTYDIFRDKKRHR